MTREAIRRLLIAAGIGLLITIGVVLPLRAAPPSHPSSSQGAKWASQATVTSTVAITPSTFVTATGAVTQPLGEQAMPTATPTLTPTLSATTTPTPTTVIPPSQTPPPTLTLIPAPTDTSTPTPPPAPSATQTPTTTPESIVAPTPIPSLMKRIVGLASANWPLAGAVCLIPLLVLALLLILLSLRKRKPQPTPPPPSAPTPAIPPAVVAGPHLESMLTPDAPRRLGLKPEGTTIGRAPENNLVITSDFPDWETVSKHHARIYQQDQHWIIEDTNSMNGVYVNGKRTGRNLLRDGWQLDIGGVEFIFRANGKEAER